MRTILMVALLAGGCASSPDMAIEGGPGQDISAAIANVENAPGAPDRTGSLTYIVGVEVANLSDHPITVTRISIAPEAAPSAFQIQRSSQAFNEMIDPGEEHVFDIRVEGMLVRPHLANESRSVAFRVMVSLSNEQTYFYSFEGPVRY